MKTKLGNKIPKNCRAILYLCEFNYKTMTIKVIAERWYTNPGYGLHAYANIPNPESQLVTGKNYLDLCKNLEILHKNMENKKWLKMLSETI